MRVEITYFSDDDEEFDTEEECLEYERGLKENFNSLIFFDEKMKLIEKPDLTNVESDAYYFYISDDAEKAKAAIDWIDYQTENLKVYDPICQGHFYGYSNDDGDFRDLTKRLSDLACIIDALDSAIKKHKN